MKRRIFSIKVCILLCSYHSFDLNIYREEENPLCCKTCSTYSKRMFTWRLIQGLKSNTRCLERITYLSWKLYSHSTCFRDQSRKPRQFALDHQNSYSQFQNITFSKGQQIQYWDFDNKTPIRQYFQCNQTSTIKKKILRFWVYYKQNIYITFWM